MSGIWRGGWRWSLVAGSSMLMAAGALAQAPPASATPGELAPYAALPGKLTLAQAVSLFKERGFDLLIADASVRNAQGNLQSAGQFANPQVNFGYGHAFGYDPYLAGGSASANFYTLNLNDGGAILDALFIGKRRLRVDVSKAALDASKLSRIDVERNLVAAVKQAWVAIVAAKVQLDINKDLLASNQQTEQLIETRYKVGAISEVDLAVQKTATYEAGQQIEIANQAYEQSKVTLAFLLGARGQTPAFEVDTSLFQALPAKELQEATPDSLHLIARDRRPDVLAQRQQVDRAQASIRLTHRQAFPDVALGFGYVQQGLGQMAISPPTLQVDFTVTPPLFYRQQGEIAMAEADLRTQEVTLAKLDAQVLSDVSTSFAAFSAARRRLDRLNQGYLAQAALARDLTRIRYEKGAATLVEVLIAQRQYVTTVQEHTQALNDLWTATFQLESAVGTEFRQ
jgi:cobalt-zinc-cadmium efflux system outer membrane protein